MRKQEYFSCTLWFSILLSFGLFVSCKKGWLDEKPQLSLAVPTSIADYQALLDNTHANGVNFNDNQSGLDEIGASDFYVTDGNWSPRSTPERNVYIYAPGDIYQGQANNLGDWNYNYTNIFYANVVLEGIDKIIPNDNNQRVAWNNVKGSAYFFRAYCHYTVAQLFCKPYIKSSANSDLGIPLRLNSDFNERSVRATVEDTYGQIISDLKQARALLPKLIPDSPLYKLRVNTAAANAMLARVYLAMEDYDNAFIYADECLKLYNTLMDYNKFVVPSTGNPIPQFNSEVIYFKAMINYGFFATARLIVDPSLFASYDPNDLRKNCYFFLSSGNQAFRGGYNVNASKFFGGIATDEVYLIRAECNARKGKKDDALKDLNTLMEKRWKAAAWTPFTATDANDALSKVLKERRKELVFRGLRWTDLRRLNQDSRFAMTLSRTVMGQTYTLPPNDIRYVLPIPDNVILLSGIQQNPR